MKASIQKYLAEFLGTLVLVFCACGTAAAVSCSGASANAAYLVTALSFGLAVTAMAYSVGNISGCHINPAVSLAMLINGKMSLTDFAGYVVAQFLGGIAGGALLLTVLDANTGLGSNALYHENVVISIVIEVILTFVFVFTVLGATSKAEHSSVAGLAIGLSLTMVHLIGIHFTGTSVNPARSLGPAVFAGGSALSCVWVFIIAPFIGGALAAVVYRFLTSDNK